MPKCKNMLVCFCASHINNKYRWSFFGFMLKSYFSQSEDSKLIVILSAADPELLRFSIDLIDHCKSKGKDIEYIVHEGKQFVKYKHAVETYKTKLSPEQWIFFTDDDDLWHPQRVQMLASLLTGEKLANQDDHMLLQFKEVLEPVNAQRLDLVPDCVQNIATCDKVDKAIDLKLVQIANNPIGEYVTYLMKFKVMQAFFDVAPRAVLEHKYADIAFVGALNRSFRYTVIRCPDPSLWMYFYRANAKVEQVCQSCDLASLRIFAGMQDEHDKLQFTEQEDSSLLTTLNFFECETLKTPLKTVNVDQTLKDIFKVCVKKYKVTMRQLKDRVAPFVKQCLKRNKEFFEDCASLKIVVA
jgi:hypothetical protein